MRRGLVRAEGVLVWGGGRARVVKGGEQAVRCALDLSPPQRILMSRPWRRSVASSPTSAPATSTGTVTSWPPLREGVIMGPQQPGALLAITCPPLHA